MRQLTMVIPALNEEENIAPTVEEILPIARKTLDSFEMILINDGSDDKTGEIMEGFGRDNPEIRVIHHPQRKGFGASYLEGISLAKMEYVSSIPGDHVVDKITWEAYFSAIGQADLVVGVRTNQTNARPFYRVALSRLYTHGINIIFGMHYTDINGLTVYPTEMLRAMGLRSTGYTLQLEALIPLTRRKMTYVEVPCVMLPSEDKSSHSLKFATLQEVLRTVWRLFVTS